MLLQLKGRYCGFKKECIRSLNDCLWSRFSGPGTRRITEQGWVAPVLTPTAGQPTPTSLGALTPNKMPPTGMEQSMLPEGDGPGRPLPLRYHAPRASGHTAFPRGMGSFGCREGEVRTAEEKPKSEASKTAQTSGVPPTISPLSDWARARS